MLQGVPGPGMKCLAECTSSNSNQIQGRTPATSLHSKELVFRRRRRGEGVLSICITDSTHLQPSTTPLRSPLLHRIFLTLSFPGINSSSVDRDIDFHCLLPPSYPPLLFRIETVLGRKEMTMGLMRNLATAVSLFSASSCAYSVNHATSFRNHWDLEGEGEGESRPLA